MGQLIKLPKCYNKIIQCTFHIQHVKSLLQSVAMAAPTVEKLHSLMKCPRRCHKKDLQLFSFS